MPKGHGGKPLPGYPALLCLKKHIGHHSALTGTARVDGDAELLSQSRLTTIGDYNQIGGQRFTRSQYHPGADVTAPHRPHVHRRRQLHTELLRPTQQGAAKVMVLDNKAQRAIVTANIRGLEYAAAEPVLVGDVYLLNNTRLFDNCRPDTPDREDVATHEIKRRGPTI